MDFFMNRKPMVQTVIFAKGDRDLDLEAQTAVGDDFFRSQMQSEFFRGYADIIYENGEFSIKCKSLPVSDEQLEQFKNDIYAVYFAGDFPFKSSKKLFGNTKMENGVKYVYDTDGYELYKVRYSDKQIMLYNNLLEYSIVIASEADLTQSLPR